MISKEINILVFNFVWNKECKDLTILQFANGEYAPSLLSLFTMIDYDADKEGNSVSRKVRYWDVLGLGALYRFIRDKFK